MNATETLNWRYSYGDTIFTLQWGRRVNATETSAPPGSSPALTGFNGAVA